MNLARLSSISVVAAFVTATGLGLLWAPPSYAQKALNVTSYGGATIDTWRRLYFEPFEKVTGISIRAETWNSNLTLVETMVKSGNVTWDVLDVGGNVVDTTCDQGLIEPFDVSRIGGKDRFFEGMVHKCGIVSKTNGSGFGYEATDFPGGEPKSIADVLDVQRFPGKRGIRARPNFTFEFMLMADGVPGDKVYEILETDAGVERVFRVLDRIKDHIVWFDSVPQAVQMLLDDEVVMTQAGSHHFLTAAAKTGRPIKFIWNGSARINLYWTIVKGSPNQDLAYQFIDFINRDDIQGEWANQGSLTGYPLKSVDAKVPDDYARTLPSHSENKKNIYVNSTEFWADHLEDYQLRLNAYQAR